jgi:hypothetical protein
MTPEQEMFNARRHHYVLVKSGASYKRRQEALREIERLCDKLKPSAKIEGEAPVTRT